MRWLEMYGNGPPIGINRMRVIRIKIATTGKNIKPCEGVHGWRFGTKLQIDTSDVLIGCMRHPIISQVISVFRCVRDVAPAHGKGAPVYPTQISTELLNKYVRQERSKNLQRIRRRAGGRCLTDFGIAVLAIGVGSYGVMIPKYAIGGFMLGVIGIGFLFSASVNFWRQWKARKLLNSNKRAALS